MNRLQANRRRYFVPKHLADQLRQPSASSGAAPGAPPPSSTFQPSSPSTPSSTSAPQASREAGAPSPASPKAAHMRDRTRESTCTHRTSDNRRCTMLRSAHHPQLCVHHARMELRALERVPVDPLGKEILGPVRDFRSHAAVNHALGKLFTLLADGRLDTRRAAVLGYLAQLMEQTLRGLRLEEIDADISPDMKKTFKTIQAAPLSPASVTTTTAAPAPPAGPSDP